MCLNHRCAYVMHGSDAEIGSFVGHRAINKQSLNIGDCVSMTTTTRASSYRFTVHPNNMSTAIASRSCCVRLCRRMWVCSPILRCAFIWASTVYHILCRS